MDSKTHLTATMIACNYVNPKYRKCILYYCTKPDEDEIDGAYKYHFYNPATRKNFRGEEETALTKLLSHYNKALDLRANNEDYGEELGRAVHFLQDICTPVHTYYEDLFDATTRLSQHVNFENRCNELCDKLDFVYNRYINDIFTQFFLNNTVKNIAKHFACKSSVLFKKYDDDSKTVDEIGKQSIHNLIIATTGILTKFEKQKTEWVW